MCLAVPAQVIKIEGESAEVQVGGIKRQVRLDLIEDVQVGDYLLVHSGFALHKLEEEEAQASLEAWRELLDEGCPETSG